MTGAGLTGAMAVGGDGCHSQMSADCRRRRHRRRRQSPQAEMRALPDVENGKDQSGSTAVMTLLSPTHVICSNTGD